QTGKNAAGNSINRYALLTLHRPTNVDNRDAFLNILAGLEELATDCPIVFPAHPRTQRRIKEFGLESHLGMNGTKIKRDAPESGKRRVGIILIDPLGYLDFLCLMKHATLVVTDSGGIQEETTCLGVSCVTIRENTERPVTVKNGTNVIGGISAPGIRKAIARQLSRRHRVRVPEKWDGQAARRIVPILANAVGTVLPVATQEVHL